MLQEAVVARTKRGEAPWRGLERVALHAKGYWESLPAHRNPVYARDGWRCAAPGCSSRRNLHDHHILYRSRLGTDVLDNRISLCAAHHQWGVHRGKLKVTGLVGRGLHWQMGVRREGPPLVEVYGQGEAYARVGEQPPS